MVTPVIRCSAQDHIPGSPRYSVFRFGWAGASIVVIECGASNVVDGPGSLILCRLRLGANAQVAAPRPAAGNLNRSVLDSNPLGLPELIRRAVRCATVGPVRFAFLDA
ncbi:hypothetical protein GCM10023319_21680 [Nocardia iowensis]